MSCDAATSSSADPPIDPPASATSPSTTVDSNLGGRLPLGPAFAALPARRIPSESTQQAVAQARARGDFELKGDQCAKCRTAGVREHPMPHTSCTHTVLCPACFTAVDKVCRNNAQLAEMFRQRMCAECAAT